MSDDTQDWRLRAKAILEKKHSLEAELDKLTPEKQAEHIIFLLSSRSDDVIRLVYDQMCNYAKIHGWQNAE